MSSFQLWDLNQSPSVAVLGQLEPDHLNVHKDYADYLNAKANITKFQTPSDHLVYFKNNPETVKIAASSKAQSLPYPFSVPKEIKSAVKLPGEHNLDNALAAIAAVASYKNISPDEYLRKYKSEIISGLQSFRGLPHRLEFLRELNSVQYYDDNFSTNPSSTRVAVNAFPSSNLVIIVGGRDKTGDKDLPEIFEILQSPQIKSILLLGESGHALAKKDSDPRFALADSLEKAVALARQTAEALARNNPDTPAVVLMSPAAASFDMFENVYDRGDQYKLLINNLSQLEI